MMGHLGGAPLKYLVLFFLTQDFVTLYDCKIIMSKNLLLLCFVVESNCIRINITLAGGNNVTMKLKIHVTC